MNNLEKYVATFPRKIVNKMAPLGSSINPDYLYSYKNCLFFNSCEFWLEANEEGFLVRVGSKVDRDRVKELLQKPEKLSRARPSTKKAYSSIVNQGKVLEEEGLLKIHYKVENDKGLDKVFDAFYYQFKPLLMATLPVQ